ncbi:RloB family protein [Streptomyces sp. NPDC023838]|uniref:RloB family protein n=1 Tax=Streptomyces sp. NPDC023838 TaxID=3154325 RepID=UPI0033C9DA4C
MNERGGQQQNQGLSKAEKRRLRRSQKGEQRPPAPPRLPPREESKEQRVLYVGCEGEVTEPHYLDYLNKQFGEGDGIRRPFRIQAVSAANGLIPSHVVAAVRAAAKEYEAWALFDRDDHHEIPQALKEAAESNIEVCFSHPSFELWLLLHFQPFSGARSGKNDDVLKKLRAAHKDFKNFDVRNDKSIQGNRRAALNGKEAEAAKRAKSLVKQCEHGLCNARPDNVGITPVERDAAPESTMKWAARSGHAATCEVLDRDPSTDVWRLLESLGIVTSSG